MRLKSTVKVFCCIFCASLLMGNHVLRAQALLADPNEAASKEDSKISKVSMTLNGQFRLIGIYDFNALQYNESFNILSIPTGDNYNTDNRFHMDMAQSRVSANINYRSDKLGDITSYFEGDFYGGDFLGFRMRIFIINIKNITVGRTWSVFCDEDAWPDVVDFDGPPTGLWTRTAQVRYTYNLNNNSKLVFGIESPQTDITTLQSVDSTIVDTYQGFPDITAQWKLYKPWGHLQLSAIYRRLFYDKGTKAQANSAGGAAISGLFKFRTKDNLIFQVAGGSGIAAYLTSFSGGGYDAVTSSEGNMSNIPAYGGYAAYELWFNQSMKTVLTYGFTGMSPDVEGITKSNFAGHYTSATFWWLPDEKINIGFEVVHGDVHNFYDETGHGTRLQSTFVFNF